MDDTMEPLPQRLQFRKRDKAAQPEIVLRSPQILPEQQLSATVEDEDDWHPGMIRHSNGGEQCTVKYEYLDHTADVQFHAWGLTLSEAFEQMVVCMFSYITDLSTVEELDPPITVEVSGHDMQSLLYAFMDEFLFQFCVEGFVPRRVHIQSFDRQVQTQIVPYTRARSIRVSPPTLDRSRR